ncbi:SDR family NAD(P)-dependent oxidoreductase [Sphingomonas montanisoli]|uniref:SDR family oxidoreductase n=1 Tax=Sphingomonas montanisoli TaxID=2606412 RepID=A0A5D9C1A6_9SPHN|nr:SDR family oxidoreductase [Sphingomonas montanisoli]TZG24977.1 SDR family oxidoreductase [Sphingomonas montanisoli]
MTNPLDYTAKKVLVVGGSSGIGNGIAQAFRAAGAEVHVWGTRASAADYADEDGSDLDGLGYTQVDVSSPDALLSAPAPFDGLDILVLSQGSVLYKRQEFAPAGWDKVMSINLDSVMHSAQRFHDDLKAAAGSVIVVSSIAAYRATMGNPAYAASKAAAVALVRTLGQAWAPEGIRVNGFAPSLVETKMTRVTTEHPERREKALAKIPLARFGTIEEMAGVALFLASPLAGYVVGQTIVVDGGLTL